MNFLSVLDEFNTSNKKYEKFNGFMVVTKRVDGSGLLYSDEEIITRALMNPYGNNLFTVNTIYFFGSRKLEDTRSFGINALPCSCCLSLQRIADCSLFNYSCKIYK